MAYFILIAPTHSVSLSSFKGALLRTEKRTSESDESGWR
jgi:hypothetical protein